jgi:hypothetical protein
VEYIIAGRAPSVALRTSALAAGAKVIANPVDIDSIVRDADIYLAPVRLGSGVKLRVLDALRSGVPVIAHRVSARGYQGLVDPSSLMVFTSADECLACFERLIASLKPGDAARRDQITSDYQRAFGFAAGVDRLRTALAAALPPELGPDHSDSASWLNGAPL